ncbi:MAG: hypothetical protein ABL958_05440 [Bdellovibrionia bacterium]
MRIPLIILMTLQLTFSYAGVQSYTPEAVTNYLSYISGMMAGRPLSPEELAAIDNDPQGALNSILETWVGGEFFNESARIMIQTQLTTSGGDGGVNYDFPGNLARYIAKNKLPYSQILTANYCVDNNGAKTGCDTGAPFTAGVLTTKAFMIRNTGRFNLGRAGRLLKQFMCKEYPLDTKLQIPINREELIPMFQVLKGEPNSDFGNGFACYNCHSQFGAHAQFFVKFDSTGKYVSSATGVQNPNLEAGKSFNGLFTSHFNNIRTAISETSQMFGKRVSNLAGAAEVMARTPMFVECAVKNSLKYVLRLDHSEVATIPVPLIREIASQLPGAEKATLQEIMLAALKNPLVIESVLTSGEPQ